MHAIEEHVIPPYLFGAEVSYRLRSIDGTISEKRYRTHNFSGWTQRYDLLAKIIEPQALHVDTCLKATVQLIEVPTMWQQALTALHKDPFCFVEPI